MASLFTVWLHPFTISAAESAATPPNIVYILADDLGYGDVQCLNPERGKIPTPNLDRLAGQGMRFTEAHSGSAVCTPTRYGILTGRYSWRSHLQSGVLSGYSPPLISHDRLTVPRFLEQQGYTTACIGKWHLGLKFAKDAARTNDLTQPIQEGPTTRGFDYYYGISASLDMPPFAFIENDRFTETPTVAKKWVRTGLAAPGFEAGDVLPILTQKAIEYLHTSMPGKKQPFFLYLALTAPHTPILPTKDWAGKSGLNAYGDFVMQVDWTVGQVLQALETKFRPSPAAHSSSSPVTTVARPLRKSRNSKAKGIIPATFFAVTRQTFGMAAITFRSLRAGPAKSNPARRATSSPASLI